MECLLDDDYRGMKFLPDDGPNGIKQRYYREINNMIVTAAKWKNHFYTAK